MAFKNIGKSAAVCVNRKSLFDASWHEHIEVLRICCDPVDGTALAPELACDDAHAGSVIIDNFGDLFGGDVLVAGVCHFEIAWEIGPELEAVHLTTRVSAWHFLMHNAGACCHPLYIASAKAACVAEAVGVIDFA